jgi:hypothetical protein
MIQLEEGMLLYHGSYCKVEIPDLSECKEQKDFGKGFYLTSSEEQARRFIVSALNKAKASNKIQQDQSYGFVSIFQYHEDTEMLKHYFKTANTNWVHCIAGHRKKGIFPEIVSSMQKYDIIGGKIADDATNFTLLTYLAGAYGPVGSVNADKICISLLKPERLKDQFCFRTTESLKSLTFIRSEQIDV